MISNIARSRSFALVLTFSSLFIPISVKAQEQLLRTLTVTGTGIEKIPTTLTEVNLGVEIQADTAEQAQQEIAKRTEALVNFLRSRNVEQLQTAGIRLAPRYNILDEEFIFIGYVGLNTVSFRVDTERAGDIIDEAVRIGATRINGVGFMAEESEIEIAKQQVLAKATQNARDRANTVLNALNLSPQEIVKIQIGRVTVSDLTQRNGLGIINFGTDDNAISQLPQSPVIGGEQTVSASVTLHIRY